METPAIEKAVFALGRPRTQTLRVLQLGAAAFARLRAWHATCSFQPVRAFDPRRSMDPLQKILIPIDLSVRSQPVLELAAELCRKHEAAATLLHVWDPLQVSTPHNEQLFNPRATVRDLSQLTLELETARQTLLAKGVSSVDISLEHGRADREILAFARHGHYDLIIMGTHGRTGLSHVLIGSVAERIVRRAPCPVMTVRVHDGRLEAPESMNPPP